MVELKEYIEKYMLKSFPSTSTQTHDIITPKVKPQIILSTTSQVGKRLKKNATVEALSVPVEETMSVATLTDITRSENVATNTIMLDNETVKAVKTVYENNEFEISKEELYPNFKDRNQRNAEARQMDDMSKRISDNNPRIRDYNQRMNDNNPKMSNDYSRMSDDNPRMSDDYPIMSEGRRKVRDTSRISDSINKHWYADRDEWLTDRNPKNTIEILKSAQIRSQEMGRQSNTAKKPRDMNKRKSPYERRRSMERSMSHRETGSISEVNETESNLEVAESILNDTNIKFDDRIQSIETKREGKLNKLQPNLNDKFKKATNQQQREDIKPFQPNAAKRNFDDQEHKDLAKSEKELEDSMVKPTNAKTRKRFDEYSQQESVDIEQKFKKATNQQQLEDIKPFQSKAAKRNFDDQDSVIPELNELTKSKKELQDIMVKPTSAKTRKSFGEYSQKESVDIELQFKKATNQQQLEDIKPFQSNATKRNFDDQDSVAHEHKELAKSEKELEDIMVKPTNAKITKTFGEYSQKECVDIEQKFKKATNQQQLEDIKPLQSNAAKRTFDDQENSEKEVKDIMVKPTNAKTRKSFDEYAQQESVDIELRNKSIKKKIKFEQMDKNLSKRYANRNAPEQYLRAVESNFSDISGRSTDMYKNLDGIYVKIKSSEPTLDYAETPEQSNSTSSRKKIRKRDSRDEEAIENTGMNPVHSGIFWI